MRTIKFRAWYKHDNPPLKFEQETKEGEYCRLVYRDGEFEYSYSVEVIMCDNNWIIEQFTGLTDKNGKEIYEGDITKYTLEYYDSSKKNLVGTVEFENGAFVITNNKTGFDDVHLWTVYDYGLEIEVIGNIHDNPELLK